MTIRSTALVLGVSTALGCVNSGGNSIPPAEGTATVTGNVNGQAFQAADAIATNAMIPIGMTTLANAGLAAISSNGAVCADLNANREPKNTQDLLLAFTDINPSTLQSSVPTTAGTYVVSSGTGAPPPKWAIAFYLQTDASCHQVVGLPASSGTVTLSSANSGSYAGTFDLMIPGSSGTDHVTGSFNAPNCPVAVAFLNSNRNTTCF